MPSLVYSEDMQRFDTILTEKRDNQLNMRLFGHLFCEYLTYNRKNHSLEEIEDNLKRIGYDVGSRMWELFLLRERS